MKNFIEIYRKCLQKQKSGTRQISMQCYLYFLFFFHNAQNAEYGQLYRKTQVLWAQA